MASLAICHLELVVWDGNLFKPLVTIVIKIRPLLEMSRH